MNQGEHVALESIRCCGSCKFFDGERKRHRLGFCLKPTDQRKGVPTKTYATSLCYRYAAAATAPGAT